MHKCTAGREMSISQAQKQTCFYEIGENWKPCENLYFKPQSEPQVEKAQLKIKLILKAFSNLPSSDTGGHITIQCKTVTCNNLFHILYMIRNNNKQKKKGNYKNLSEDYLKSNALKIQKYLVNGLCGTTLCF